MQCFSLSIGLALSESLNLVTFYTFNMPNTYNPKPTDNIEGTAVAQWLRCCATNRKLAGSIPAGVIGIFH